MIVLAVPQKRGGPLYQDPYPVGFGVPASGAVAGGAPLSSLLGPCQLPDIFVAVGNSRYPSSCLSGAVVSRWADASSHGRVSDSPTGVAATGQASSCCSLSLSGTAPGGGSTRQQGGAGGTM